MISISVIIRKVRIAGKLRNATPAVQRHTFKARTLELMTLQQLIKARTLELMTLQQLIKARTLELMTIQQLIKGKAI